MTDERLANLEKDEARFSSHMSAITIWLTIAAVIIGIIGITLVASVPYWVRTLVGSANERHLVERDGRLRAVQGMILGKVCRDANDQLIRPDLLATAIQMTRNSISIFESGKVPVPGMVRNNLAYYLALQDEPHLGDEALELAAGLKKDTKNDHFIDTYARVLAAYGESTKEIDETIKKVTSTIKSLTTTPDRVRVLERTLEALNARKTSLAKSNSNS